MNYIYNNEQNKKELLERFIKYVKIWSESNSEQADKGIMPSTPQQFDIAHTLESELKAYGVHTVTVTKDCYVYAYIPGTGHLQNSLSILFLAHMDTVDEVTGKNVNPQMTTKADDTIISTDKTTLLGADDKAGIAAIMTAIHYLLTNPQIPHCPIEIIFSPDEETGHGMDKVPLQLIKSKYAYTVDGGSEGEMESECFNAYSAKVTFLGKSSHTGDARKNRMVNAVQLASNFINNLPKNMLPETTDGYLGFIAPMEISGCIEKAQVNLLLRSFDMTEIEKQQKIIKHIAESITLANGGEYKIDFKQQYLNMKEKMEQNSFVIEKLIDAYKNAGVQIIQKPIRGGTDGSRLTEMGIPTPNIFTGAHEIHSRNEWCSLNQMAKASDVIINLVIN